ncbi:MAG: hypothetical protein AB4368_26545 [Xenococcaceae cyanobacterium]
MKNKQIIDYLIAIAILLLELLYCDRVNNSHYKVSIGSYRKNYLDYNISIVVKLLVHRIGVRHN